MTATTAKPASRKKKILAGVAAFSIAATTLIGGSLAVLTDRDTTAPQTLQAGTVDIELSDDELNPNFRTAIAPMAPGDTFSRYVNLNNVGNLAVNRLSISQVNGGGKLIEGPEGVVVEVDVCDEPWVNGACAGTEVSPAIPPVALRGWGDSIPLPKLEMEPTETLYFKFKTSLPEAADNSYQAEASWVRYTFNGVQRNSQVDDGSGNPPVENEPPAPEVGELLVTNVTDRDVSLAWGVGKHADRYRVERSDEAEGPWQVLTIGKETSMVDQSVRPATTYYYRLVYLAPDGQSSVSDTVEVTTLVSQTAPALSQTSSTPSSVTLSWASVTGASGYEIQQTSEPVLAGGAGGGPGMLGRSAMMAAAEPEYTTVATLEGNVRSYTVSSLEPGKYYYFRLAPVGGQPSEVTMTSTKLARPSVTIEQGETPTAITVSWEPVNGAESYTVKQSTSPDMANATTETVAGTSVQRTLSGTAAVYYQVVATSAAGITADSTPRGVNADARATSVSTVSTGSDSITVNWKSTANAKTYHLYYNMDPNASPVDFTEAYSGTATSFSHTGLPAASLMYYWVGVEDHTGTIYYSPVAEGYTQLKPVQAGLETATANSLSFKIAGWKTGSSAKIFRSEEGVTGVKPAEFGTSSPTWTNTGLNINSTYNYSGSVRYALRGLGKEPIEVSTGFSVSGSTLPGASTITALSPSDKHITVNWLGIKNATGYVLERSPNADFSEPVIVANTAGNVNSFRDEGLQSSTPYWYRVTTLFATGEREVSGVKTATTAPLSMAMTAASTSPSTVQLSWSEAAPGAQYTVTRSAAGGSETQIYSGTARVFEDKDLTGATAYSYKVTARDKFGKTTSATASATTDLAKASVQVVAAAEETATLSWSSVSGAGEYLLHRSTNPSMGARKLIYRGTATSFSDSELTPEKGYYYTVTAKTGTIESTSSVASLVTTAASIALTLEATAPKEVKVSWTAVNGATNYTVLRSETADLSDPVQVYSGPGTEHVDATVLPGLTYYYRILTGNGSSVVEEVATPLPSISLTATKTRSSDVEDLAVYRLQWTAVEGAQSYSVYRVNAQGNVNRVCSTATDLYCSVDVPAAAKTSYYVTAFAENDREEATSEPVEVEEGLQPIGELTATKELSTATSATLKLKWAMPSSFYSYKLERSESADFGSPVTLLEASGASSYSDVALSPSKFYYYRVTSSYNGYSSTTAVKEFATAIPATKLSLTGTSASRALTWTPVAGATKYVLTRKLAGAAAETVYEGSAQGFTDTSTLTEGATYVYSVKAVTPVGDSTASSANFVMQTNGTFPVATSVKTFSATLEWAAATNASSYRLRVARDEAMTDLVSNTTGNATYRSQGLTGLTAETTYYATVTTTAANGTSSTSAPVAFTTTVDPVKLVATNTSPTANTLTWQPVEGADGYVVNRSTTPSGAGTQVYSGSATGYTDGSLAIGQRYYYTVQPRKAGANHGDGSAQASAYTLWDSSTPAFTATPSSTSVAINTTLASSVPGAASTAYQIRMPGTETWSTRYTTQSYVPSFGLSHPFYEGAAVEVRMLFTDAEGNTKATPVVSTTHPLTAPTRRSVGSQSEALEVGVSNENSYLYADTIRTQMSLAEDFSNPITATYAPNGVGIVDGMGGRYAATGSTYYTVTGLAPDTKYYVRSRFENSTSGAQSTWSQFSGTYYSAPRRAIPTITPAETTATVTWQPQAGAKSYAVAQCFNSSCSFAATGLTSTSYTITGLQPGENYKTYVRVQGANGYMDSGLFDYSTKFAGPSLAQPTAAQITASGATINWTKVGATGDTTRYTVQYSTTPDFTTPVTVASNLGQSTTAWTINTVQPNTKLYVRVLAFRSATNETAYSNVVEFTTTPAAPTGFALTSAGAVDSTRSTLTGSWTAVSGASKYRVYVAEGNVSATPTTFEVTTNSFSLSTFRPDTAYYMQVTAVTDDGRESPKSAQASTVATPPLPTLSTGLVDIDDSQVNFQATNTYNRFSYVLQISADPNMSTTLNAASRSRLLSGDLDTRNFWAPSYSGLMPGGTYYAQVRVTGDNRGGVYYSPVVSFTLNRSSTSGIASFEPGENGVTFQPVSNYIEGTAGATAGRQVWSIACAGACARTASIRFYSDGTKPLTFDWRKLSASSTTYSPYFYAYLDGAQVFFTNAAATGGASIGTYTGPANLSAGWHELRISAGSTSTYPGTNVSIDNIKGIRYIDTLPQ